MGKGLNLQFYGSFSQDDQAVALVGVFKVSPEVKSVVGCVLGVLFLLACACVLQNAWINQNSFPTVLIPFILPAIALVSFIAQKNTRNDVRFLSKKINEALSKV